LIFYIVAQILPLGQKQMEHKSEQSTAFIAMYRCVTNIIRNNIGVSIVQTSRRRNGRSHMGMLWEQDKLVYFILQ
jgi:hypothetical protein